ncbi:MAG TPA: dephospho-CoA kinase [Caproiciproducens sp.]|nr:dephospho-CoA kinase [Caproiciproducens sp.]
MVIGLTGPTGAGKSTVAAAWEKAGCTVVDADKIAREAVLQPACVAELKAEFGDDIADEKGNLDRRLLAKRAFCSSQKTEKLNAITHPKIMEEVTERISLLQQGRAKAIILDAPLLFESGADRLCDTAVAVTAPVEIRRNRIMARDSIPAELAMERIGAQHENSYYSGRAAYVFDGSVNLGSVSAGAQELLERILGEYHESI